MLTYQAVDGETGRKAVQCEMILRKPVVSLSSTVETVSGLVVSLSSTVEAVWWFQCGGVPEPVLQPRPCVQSRTGQLGMGIERLQ